MADVQGCTSATGKTADGSRHRGGGVADVSSLSAAKLELAFFQSPLLFSVDRLQLQENS